MKRRKNIFTKPKKRIVVFKCIIAFIIIFVLLSVGYAITKSFGDVFFSGNKSDTASSDNREDYKVKEEKSTEKWNIGDEITALQGVPIDFGKFVKVGGKRISDISIKGKVDYKKTGSYKITLEAKRDKQVVDKKTVDVKVVSVKNAKDDNLKFTTGTGKTGQFSNGILVIDGIEVVNKSFRLTEDYVSEVNRESDAAFFYMRKDALKENYNIYIMVGYKSYSAQKKAYEEHVNDKGIKAADKYPGKPGASEGQLREALDIGASNVEAEKWINNNCYKYGFIIRYPKGKENFTGYEYRPLHIRYVGKELAAKLYNKGKWISLEEYFGIPGRYMDDKSNK